MHYKTIVLNLLEQRPNFHEQLRQVRQLLSALDLYALALKTLHESRSRELSQGNPDSDPCQIQSEALELAIRDLEEGLPSESPVNEDEPLSLERAMMFLSRHTPPE